MLAGWRSRRSGQMRQIRFDTRAVPAFFFCSSTTSPRLSTLLSIVTFLFFFLFRIFLLDGLVFQLPREVRLAKGAQLERVGRVMQMPTITERQSGRKLTSGDMAAGSLLLLLVLFFFFFLAFFSKRRRSEESGANKRPRLYKLRETDDGAAARGRARSS